METVKQPDKAPDVALPVRASALQRMAALVARWHPEAFVAAASSEYGLPDCQCVGNWHIRN